MLFGLNTTGNYNFVLGKGFCRLEDRHGTIPSPRSSPFKTLLDPNILSRRGLTIYLAEKKAAGTDVVQVSARLQVPRGGPHPGGIQDSGDTRGLCTE